MEYDVLEYLTVRGVSPFSEWRTGLDVVTRARIYRIVERLRDGNLGDHKGIGEGVIETRIDCGPGYRIYYGFDGRALVILLAGGDKTSQPRDIERAKERWNDYKDRKRGGF